MSLCPDRSGSSDVLGEFANWYDQVEFVYIVHDGVGIALFVTFHYSFTCNPADAWVVPETDLGGLTVSPRWRFCGLGKGLGSNEKVEMTLSTRLGEGRTGLIYVFLPWLYWLLMSNETTAAS